MTTQDDRRRKSPVDRFRNILSDDRANDEEITSARGYAKRTGSPGLNLPAPKRAEDNPAPPSILVPLGAGANPRRFTGSRLLPAFWTIASIVSVVVNAVLVVILVGLLRSAGSIDAAGIGANLLGGLYSNFERMDSAHIKTSIPVQTNIPLDLNVPVQTTTSITLAKAASIPGAHVKISTALFNIDAPANVTLPAGTALDVALNFSVPLQTQIPVSLDVPVDIPLRKTELHPAILGLQDTLRPLYCMVTPSAQKLNGDPVCK